MAGIFIVQCHPLAIDDAIAEGDEFSGGRGGGQRFIELCARAAGPDASTTKARKAALRLAISMAAPIPLPTTSARQTPIFSGKSDHIEVVAGHNLRGLPGARDLHAGNLRDDFGQQIGLYFRGGLQLSLLALHSLEAL